MFKNYFSTALRNIWKNRSTTVINLFGLSVGMTAAVFIFLWVQNEMSFNDYHADKENIYRVTNSIQVSKEEAWIWESSPLLLGEFAVKQIPGVRQAARVISNSWGGPVLSADDHFFAGKTSAFVDKNWFSLFKYD